MRLLSGSFRDTCRGRQVNDHRLILESGAPSHPPLMPVSLALFNTLLSNEFPHTECKQQHPEESSKNENFSKC